MSNSVDLDETARYELSHRDPHCSQRYLFVCWAKQIYNDRTRIILPVLCGCLGAYVPLLP